MSFYDDFFGDDDRYFELQRSILLVLKDAGVDEPYSILRGEADLPEGFNLEKEYEEYMGLYRQRVADKEATKVRRAEEEAEVEAAYQRVMARIHTNDDLYLLAASGRGTIVTPENEGAYLALR